MPPANMPTLPSPNSFPAEQKDTARHPQRGRGRILLPITKMFKIKNVQDQKSPKITTPRILNQNRC
jgi:hypothetical protein